MAAYILVIIFAGQQIQMQEFSSIETCEKAKTSISSESSGYPKIIKSWCQQK